MTKDEALKLALAVLEKHKVLGTTYPPDHKAITAIKEALAQPEQEPVKFEAVWDSGPTNKDYEDAMRLKRLQQLTTPPQRKPLTDEEIEDIWADCPADWDDKINVLTLARAIEAAHGIKDNT